MSCPCPSALLFADRRSWLRWTAGNLVLVAVLVGVWWTCPWPASAQVAAHRAPRSSTPRPTAPGPVVVYRPPVTAPILDPFRPPTTPYGPGNRGIEYATVPGTSVGAAADGVVVFAGPVAEGCTSPSATTTASARPTPSSPPSGCDRASGWPGRCGRGCWGRCCTWAPDGATPTSIRRRCGGGPSVRPTCISSRWTATRPGRRRRSCPGRSRRLLGWVGPGFTGLGMGALPGVTAGIGGARRRW